MNANKTKHVLCRRKTNRRVRFGIENRQRYYREIENACARKELIHKVEVAQKLAIRIIGFGHYLEHTTPNFIRMHILKFPDLARLYMAKQMHLYFTDNIPEPLAALCNRNTTIHEHATRQQYNPHHIQVNTAFARGPFISQGPRLWSSLAHDLREIHSTSVFVNRYKKKNIH